MPVIAVVHPNMMSAGGAESFAMVVLEALPWIDPTWKEKARIVFITDGKVDFKALNEKFDNNVDAENICVVHPFLCSMVGKLEHRIHLFANLELALFSRCVKKHLDEYDMVVSTKGEMDIGKPGIQIMPHIPSMQGKAYGWLLRCLGRDEKNIKKNITICHSKYIQNGYDAIYGGGKSYVIDPPIRKCPKNKEWGERENGFLVVGRIDKEKETDKAIELIDKVREHLPDAHLHIIGAGKGRYYRRIEQMAKDRDYVYLEGFVTTERYFEIITSHKYAVHMREGEPAAVTIRELIDGGTIPFGHYSGGNIELLPNELLFNYGKFGELTISNAAYKIAEVLKDERLQKTLLQELKKIKLNDRGEWKKQFERIVNEEKKEDNKDKDSKR